MNWRHRILYVSALSLAAGLVDRLTAAGIPAFGPSAAAARLEASKAFAKEVMEAAGVPTAAWTSVATVDEGMAAITSYPTVLKYDGLAAGKGVVIAPDAAAARATLEDFLVGHRFGTERVVVEEHLDGEELSLLALCDGVRAIPLAPAQDYKRIFDGDRGPNTGGMGSYSPVAGIDAERAQEIATLVHQPIVDELARRGTPFTRIRFRAPPPDPEPPPDAGRTSATSTVSRPANPSMRASSLPQRTSSPSLEVRCERPHARRTIASRSVVLPAAFGPTISCGPGPKLVSRVE